MSAERQPSDERFEEAVVGLLAERGRTTNGDIRAVLEGIAALPDRSPGRNRSWLAAAAAVAVLVLGGGLILGRLQLPAFGSADGRVGRAAFANDPRLAACEAQMGVRADQAFEMTQARWFPLYFPGWYRGAPELQVADPALVVIGPTGAPPRLMRNPRLEPSDATSTPMPTPSPSFPMCIAVGPPGDATVHDYGWTWFDRIVPVLSEAEVALAPHLDPDVLTDPAAWRFPERLTPCGGLSGNEQAIFESRLSELRSVFPHLTNVQFPDDDPVAVIVYRDPLPGLAHESSPPGADLHDVCLASELDGANPTHVTLPDVDITGFHVMIDKELTDPPIVAPGPSTIPSEPVITPEPMPAWASGATASLQCDGPPSSEGPTGPQDTRIGLNDPDSVVFDFLRFVEAAGLVFPTEGFAEAATAPAARLYTYPVGGKDKAALVLMAAGGDESATWSIASVASCDPSEFDPRTPIGGGVHVWHDKDGLPVRLEVVFERDDCSGATSITVLGRLFLRDPDHHIDASQLDATYAASTALPKGAGWLGFLDGTKAMWTAVDGTALYIVDDNDKAHAERLPHVQGDAIQRIDCN